MVLNGHKVLDRIIKLCEKFRDKKHYRQTETQIDRQTNIYIEREKRLCFWSSLLNDDKLLVFIIVFVVAVVNVSLH